MSAVSLADKKRLFFEDYTGLSGKSVTDLEWNYYSSRSGLTPVARYSIADHKRAYFEAQTGLSKVPLSRLERQFFGADTGESLADAMSKFFFSPREYPGLELALDASLISGLTDGAAVPQWNDFSGNGRHLAQALAANRPLYRNANPNKLLYTQAIASVVGVNGWTNGNAGTTLAVETAAPITGSSSIKATLTSGADIRLTTGNPRTSVKPSILYYGHLKVKNNATGIRGVNVYVEYYDSAGAYLATRTIGSVNIAAGAVATITGEVSGGNSPATAATAYILVLGASTGGWLLNESLVVDEAMLSESPIAQWLPPVTLPSNRPVVQFNGVTQFLSLTNYAANHIKRTVYLVVDRPVMPASTIPILNKDTANWYVGVTGANLIQSHIDAGSVQGTISGPSSSQAPQILVYKFEVDAFGNASLTAKLQNFRDGASSAIFEDAGSTSSVTTTLKLGLFSTNIYFEGSIMAVYIYSTAHDNKTRRAIERALGEKYGIAVA